MFHKIRNFIRKHFIGFRPSSFTYEEFMKEGK